MDIGIASIIASIILSFGAIVASIIFSYVPRQRKEIIDRLRIELYEVYNGVEQLKQVEEDLENQLGISKQNARKNVMIPIRFEKVRLANRISQLEKQIK